MIEVKQLTKKYGDRLAIEGLNFQLKENEVLGFLGPNGAGKSTTMKLMTGYMAPTSGTITIDGFDIQDEPIRAKNLIGYLPELPPVYPQMRVIDYLKFVADLKQVDKSKKNKFIQSAMEKTELGQVQKRFIGHLSKGFQQRVGLAQALVSQPKYLILDEPTVGLDPKQVAGVRSLLKELKKEHSIILSTHILSEVQATCDSIVIINESKIITHGNLQEISDRLSGGSKLIIKVVQKSSELQTKIQADTAVQSCTLSGQTLTVHLKSEPSVLQRISDLVFESGAGLLEFKTVDAALEDVFIQLVK